MGDRLNGKVALISGSTRRKESGAIAFNMVLLALAVVVAWGRFGPYAF
ncbi:hypothetical protein AB0D57_17785 [Streptomyces sp. NPDC048275]